MISNVTIKTLNKLGKISCLTAYDATFTSLLNKAGVDVILVGDSLGMVVQGHSNTLPVTMTDMLYHTRCVVKSNDRALIMSDMPFASFNSPDTAINNATNLVKAGANMIKIEGCNDNICNLIKMIVSHGIPVCGHLGLTPQTINTIGSFSVQGKTTAAANEILNQAYKLTNSGCSMIVLECIPCSLAKKITESIAVPTVGIGSGQYTTGQILVTHDLLGLNDMNLTFVRKYIFTRFINLISKTINFK